jgi:hypothetical protein
MLRATFATKPNSQRANGTFHVVTRGIGPSLRHSLTAVVGTLPSRT